MPARYEQIGQCAGHEQAMGVFLQPAIAHLGKAEHPLDDPDPITGQLIDAVPGTHLWADRFDGSLGEVIRLKRGLTELSAEGAVDLHCLVSLLTSATIRPRVDRRTAPCLRQYLGAFAAQFLDACSDHSKIVSGHGRGAPPAAMTTGGVSVWAFFREASCIGRF